MVQLVKSNNFYYSFKTFPRFRLAKSTRIIHHNQQLMTNDHGINKPKTSKVQLPCSLMHRQPRRPGDEVELFSL